MNEKRNLELYTDDRLPWILNALDDPQVVSDINSLALSFNRDFWVSEYLEGCYAFSTPAERARVMVMLMDYDPDAFTYDDASELMEYCLKMAHHAYDELMWRLNDASMRWADELKTLN